MTVPGSANPLLLRSAAPTAYQVSRSLRFNSADSAYLSRTPASAGNRKTWTWSGWVKRTTNTNGTLFSAYKGSGIVDTEYFGLDFTSDSLRCTGYSTNYRITTQVFRDYSAWYHIVVVIDTTNATANDRLKIYVNGTQITTFSTTNNPSLNADLGVNQASEHTIGRQTGFGEYFNGYLANVEFVDGSALTPSSFAETDATTGQWIPKLYSGSYGTNGFKLTFADNSNNTASTLGADSSGNGNHWSPTNLSVLSGTVASAGGGIPLLNTTDAYGTVLGTGVRSDSNASSLSLALPLGTSSGLNLTDQMPTGRTTSAHTITNTNVTNTTSTYKYYGGSASFDESGDYLTVTNSSALVFGSGDFTVEFWIKPNNSANDQAIINQGTIGSSFLAIGYYGSQNSIFIYDTTWRGYASISNGVWSHVAFVKSGTTLTTYINGAVGATTTSWTPNFSSTNDFYIGKNVGQLDFLGNLQDVRFYKGLAKYTSTFSVPSLATGAGNDALTDSPTSYGSGTSGGDVRGNFATLNPLDNGGTTLSNGNLDVTKAGAGFLSVRGTIGMSSGKWYWEYTRASGSGNNLVVGLAGASANITTYFDISANGYGYRANDGNKTNNNTASSYGASYAAGDVVGIAFDADAGSLTFYKNGTSQGTAFTSLTSGPYFPAVAIAGGDTGSLNFGQRAFAYTPPANYQPLVDTYLPTPTVAKPSEVMDVKLYTGNGSTQAISGLGFSPDFIWVKGRSTSARNRLFNIISGVQKELYSDLTNAEASDVNSIQSFDSAGFTLGSNDANTNGTTYVAWAWDAGTTTSSNGSGSITSSCRTNQSSGFSIVSFTVPSNGTDFSVGHGLGVTPSLVITKGRGASDNWVVYHSSVVTSISQYLRLNTTDSLLSTANIWGTSLPTSTVFSGRSGNLLVASQAAIAYCFAPVAGYSAMGSYVGNGSSTSGPFVYLGFRPRFLLVKSSTGAENWDIYDSSRGSYNLNNLSLQPNLSGAEYNAGSLGFDFLSNGFRSIGGSNTNGATYIYFAVAESPFAYSRAR